MKSIFTDKERKPTISDLKKALGDSFEIWQSLATYVSKCNSKVLEDWKYSSDKYGWSYHISDKKRVLIYLLPRDRFFKIAFVFGKKAADDIFASDISGHLINELKSAKVYAEGRGIRIEVKDKSDVDDIKKLIAIKIAN